MPIAFRCLVLHMDTLLCLLQQAPNYPFIWREQAVCLPASITLWKYHSMGLLVCIVIGSGMPGEAAYCVAPSWGLHNLSCKPSLKITKKFACM